MKAALTLVVALSLSASAFAQQEARNEREYRSEYDQLIFGLRNSLPTGEAFNGTRWGELVSGGIGIEIQYQELWRTSSRVYAGWYAGIAVDSFGGRSFSLTDATARTTPHVPTAPRQPAGLPVGRPVGPNIQPIP